MAKKRFVMTVIMLMAVPAVLVFAGGNGQKSGAAQTASTRNLGGMEIIVHRWGGNYDTATYKPQSDADRRTLDYRIGIEKQYNFKIIEKHVGGGWGELRDSVMTSIPAGTPDAHIYIIQP
ncbi:MAG: hypothetical protein LBG76_01640, partial [Treponema sp.]|nr:hypothetical protein [Treponema sp.]